MTYNIYSFLIFLHKTMSQSLHRLVSCLWILFNLSEWMASSNWWWWEDRGCIQCDSYLLHRENVFVFLFREMGLYIFIALEAQLSHVLTRHYAEMLSLAIVCSAFTLMLHLLCARWQETYPLCVFFKALEGSFFHSQGLGSLFTMLLKNIYFLSPFTARYISIESIFQIKSHIEKISHWLSESKHNINVHLEKDSRSISTH